MEPSSDTLKLQPGDLVHCQVEASEPGGYLVSICASELKGFLPSRDLLQPGLTVASTFICMSGDKALLSHRAPSNLVRDSAHGNKKTFLAQPSPSNTVPFMSGASAGSLSLVDTRAQIRWVQRAVDLFMPPLAALPSSMRISPDQVDGKLTRFELERFTGCLKVDAANHRSRSAALFYQGRAVGAIYGRKSLTERYRIETSLLLMLEDMRHMPTDIEYYCLPEEFVLSLAAIFMGVLLERPYGFKADEYAQAMLKQFRENGSTGCLSLHQDIPCALIFIWRGSFAGSYLVDERLYGAQESTLRLMFDRFPKARLEAYILPDVIIAEAARFGYGLTTAPFGRV